MTAPSSPTENSLSATVIEAVAEEMDCEPGNLPEPLYESINPDALNMLFEGQDRANGVLTFFYCGYDVTVTADGDVTLER
jgi:hypothetical protein